MADQVIALELNIDTNAPDALDQIQQKIEELKQKVAGAKDGTQELVDAQAQLSQAQDLYQQLTTAADTHTQSVKGGTEAYREFRSETRQGLGNLLSLQKGTAEYNAELKKIASHKAEFRELQEQLRSADPTKTAQSLAQLGRTGTEAFRGIGAAAAFATGSDDEFLKTLFKVEAASEAMNGVIAIQEILHKRAAIAIAIQTAAQQLLNFVTSPFGAIITGASIALVAFFAYLKRGNEEVIEKEKERIAAFKDAAEESKSRATAEKTVLDAELEQLKAQEAPLNVILDKENEIWEVKKKMAKADVDIADADRQEAQNKADQAAGLAAEYKKTAKDRLDAAEEIYKKTGQATDAERVQKYYYLYNAAIENNAAVLKKHHPEEYKALMQANQLYDQRLATVKAINIEEDTAHIKGNKKSSDDAEKAAKDRADKIAALKKKVYDQDLASDLEHAADQAKLQDLESEQELKDQKDADEKKILQMKIEGVSERDIINAEIEEKLKLNKDGENGILKIQIEGAAKLKALDEKEANDSIATAQKAAAEKKRIREGDFTTAAHIADGLVSLGDILSKKGKEQNEIQKGLALVKIGVDTARAISAAVAASSENPANAVTFGGAGAIQLASSIAEILGNIAQAKAILEGGDSGSISTSSGGGSPSYSAPQINSTVFGANPKTDKNGNADYGYNGMIKAYVTSTDLDEQQRRNYYQNLNRRAH